MFEVWTYYIIVSVIAVIIEIFVPVLYGVNFAFAGILTALISVFWGDLYTTLIIFVILSLISITFIRPMLEKYLKKSSTTDFNEKYIGKIVKVIEPVTLSSGAVTVYEERWEARTKQEENIDAGHDAKIIGNDGLILFVERI